MNNWKEDDKVVLNKNKIEKIIFKYVPEDGSKQAIIGNFSRAITEKYNALTTQDVKIKKHKRHIKKEILSFI